MNGGSGGGGCRGGKKVSGMPLVQRKDRDDEDLVLFRELDKREKDRIASLLLPVSEEFEPNAAPGNYALYRIASRKKGSGYEFFAENDRNDYDWLKTPPATPLFPSLEMEAKASELVVQREIPILQPLTRFSGNSAAATNESTARPKSLKPKPKVPIRSITPSHQKQKILSTENKNTKTGIRNTAKTTGEERNDTDFLTSNLSKNVGLATARSRGVSPSVRSTIPAQIYGFSNDPTPPNLRSTPADRSTSAARNRPAGANASLSTITKRVSDDPPPPNLRTTSATRGYPARINGFSNDPGSANATVRPTSAARNRPTGLNSSLSTQISQFFNDPPPPNLKTDRSTSATRGRSQNPSASSMHQRGRKESRSPSVTRDRKVEMKQQQENSEGNGNNLNGNLKAVRFQTGIVGSRMVEKVMNARKYSEEKETESNTVFGRNVVSKASLDVPLKHTEMKRDRPSSRHQGTVRGRSLTRSSE